MPAKPLSPEQQRDAARLKLYFQLWQSSQKEKGEPYTQDEVAEQFFGIGQSALSQYLNGTIPLNARILAKFSQVLGVKPDLISRQIAEAQRDLAACYSEDEQMSADEARAIALKKPVFAPAPSPASPPKKTHARSSMRNAPAPNETETKGT